jgi:ABC-type sugar transport system ATPase subunit
MQDTIIGHGAAGRADLRANRRARTSAGSAGADCPAPIRGCGPGASGKAALVSDQRRDPLRLRGISKSFGPVQALIDVDLDIPAREVTALLGDNGAGKSVLVKSIAGIHSPDHGEIRWEGTAVRMRSPRDAAALGIETVYQDLALFDNLRPTDNFYAGRELAGPPSWTRSRWRRPRRDAREPGGHDGQSIRQPVPPSGGQRQSVAIASLSSGTRSS